MTKLKLDLANFDPPIPISVGSHPDVCVTVVDGGKAVAVLAAGEEAYFSPDGAPPDLKWKRSGFHNKL